MRLAVFFFSAVLLFSCGESAPADGNVDSNSTTASPEIVQRFDASSIQKLNEKEIPANCNYKGKLKVGFTWKDKLGENVFIASESGEIGSESFNEEIGEYIYYKEANVYAYHYVVSGSEVKLIRELHDFESKCEFDVNANFLPSTIQVTDLDSDNFGEVWMMYRTYCLSDVSPSDLKIIMFQNGQKYALRGESQIDWGDGTFYGGKFKYDDAFTSGPEVFRNFANTIWKEHIDGY